MKFEIRSNEKNNFKKKKKKKKKLKTLQVIGETIAIPNSNVKMFKRNVSDIKFEIASNEEEGDNMIATAVLQQTDIIPGVYEGGLKTWECSIDLVKYLSEQPNEAFENKTVLEVLYQKKIIIIKKEINKEINKNKLDING